MFNIGNGTVVDFWSNGVTTDGPDYGVAVARPHLALDYVGGGVTAVATAIPEPATWAMMLVGFAGIGFAGYRRARAGHATVIVAKRTGHKVGLDTATRMAADADLCP